MPDLAQLELRIVSTQVREATQRLKELQSSGAGAEAQAARLTRAQDRMNSSLETGARFVKGLVAGFLSFRAVQEFIRTADTVTELNNRLRLVTDSEEELLAVQEELFESANRTRTAYEGTAELYARVALSAQELGKTQQELLQFTESVNQAIILSGANATEASAGIIQLAQGMASGALRGDELRSVLEQLPAVADVIARSLGVTRGQLRGLAEEGKITADVIFDAFERSREELADRFAKIVPTVAQSFVVFRNNLAQFIAEVDRSSGATESLSEAILVAGRNIEFLVRASVALAGSIAALVVVNRAVAAFTALRTAVLSASAAMASARIISGITGTTTAVGGLTVGIRALTAAVKANPVGLLVTALTTAGIAFAAFSTQEVPKAERNIEDFNKSLRESAADLEKWEKRLQTALRTGNAAGEVSSLTGRLDELREQFQQLQQTGGPLLKIAPEFVENVPGLRGIVETQREAFEKSADAIRQGIIPPPTLDFEAITEAFETEIARLEMRIEDARRRLPEKIAEATMPDPKAVKRASDAFQELFATAEFERTLVGLTSDERERATTLRKAEALAVEGQVKNADTLLRKLKELLITTHELTAAEKAEADAKEAQARAQDRLSGSLSDVEAEVAALERVVATGEDLADVREEMELVALAVAAFGDGSEDAAEQLQKLINLIQRRKQLQEDQDAETKRQAEEKAAVEDLRRRGLEVAGELGSAFGGAATGFITGMNDAGEALDDLGKRLQDFALRQIEQVLTEAFARSFAALGEASGLIPTAGGVAAAGEGGGGAAAAGGIASFLSSLLPLLLAERGRIVGLQQGGVLARPTLLQRGGSTFVAGEGMSRTGARGSRQPEGVLPLERDFQGRLGVRAAGMGGPAQEIRTTNVRNELTVIVRADDPNAFRATLGQVQADAKRRQRLK